MIMPYFLSGNNLSNNQAVTIAGEEARHILLSFRVRKGEKIKIQGPDEKRYLTEVVDVGKNQLIVKVLERLSVPIEPKISTTLFQSAVSEKALDFIFQKGTELGLSRIILFNSKNTATKLSKEVFKRKEERWQKILQEAAKQCERVRPPVLEFGGDVAQILEKASHLNQVFLTDPSGNNLKSAIPNLKSPKSIGLVVGPEGGFASEEVARFKSSPNCTAISLGPILLRAETAALAAASLITNLF